MTKNRIGLFCSKRSPHTASVTQQMYNVLQAIVAELWLKALLSLNLLHIPIFEVKCALRGPLHGETQTGLSFRPARVHVGVWSKS